MATWVRSLAATLRNGIVTVDGKAVRHSHDHNRETASPHRGGHGAAVAEPAPGGRPVQRDHGLPRTIRNPGTGAAWQPSTPWVAQSGWRGRSGSGAPTPCRLSRATNRSCTRPWSRLPPSYSLRVTLLIRAPGSIKQLGIDGAEFPTLYKVQLSTTVVKQQPGVPAAGAAPGRPGMAPLPGRDRARGGDDAQPRQAPRAVERGCGFQAVGRKVTRGGQRRHEAGQGARREPGFPPATANGTCHGGTPCHRQPHHAPPPVPRRCRDGPAPGRSDRCLPAGVERTAGPMPPPPCHVARHADWQAAVGPGVHVVDRHAPCAGPEARRLRMEGAKARTATRGRPRTATVRCTACPTRRTRTRRAAASGDGRPGCGRARHLPCRAAHAVVDKADTSACED